MTPLLTDRPRPPGAPRLLPPGNSFVLPDDKIVYLSVTKAACTSLRWMIAGLAGEDFERFYRAPAAHQTRLMTIHTHRSTWQHAPQLKDLPPEVFDEISRDNGWFIFAVVRDPWTRLWSAWQSKFLVRHPFYLDQYGAEPWFPRVPDKPTEVLEDWRAFIAAEPWRTNESLAADPHFMTQVRSARPRRVNYTRIYDLRNLDELTSDLQAHLARLGRSRPLYLPRANENPLSLIPAIFDDGIDKAIEDAYSEDFEVFAGRWSFDDLRFPATEWTDDAIRTVAYHSVANERINDLARELRRARQRLAAIEEAGAPVTGEAIGTPASEEGVTADATPDEGFRAP